MGWKSRKVFQRRLIPLITVRVEQVRAQALESNRYVLNCGPATSNCVIEDKLFKFLMPWFFSVSPFVHHTEHLAIGWSGVSDEHESAEWGSCPGGFFRSAVVVAGNAASETGQRVNVKLHKGQLQCTLFCYL